jgi:uncharacterized tellurite resistance protein B-like protein
MSLAARLSRFVSDSLGLQEADDGRLAVAALLVHVARVDGRIVEAERARVTELLAARYGLDEVDAERLAARGGALSRGAQLADLVEAVGRGPLEERRWLLAMAYKVAATDGAVEEFEEDLIWRAGRLLGFDDAAVRAIRAEAIEASGSR